MFAMTLGSLTKQSRNLYSGREWKLNEIGSWRETLLIECGQVRERV